VIIILVLRVLVIILFIFTFSEIDFKKVKFVEWLDLIISFLYLFLGLVLIFFVWFFGVNNL